MRLLIALFVGFLSFLECRAEGNTLWNATDTDRLKADLLRNYDKNTRPENHNVATKCNIGMTLINIDLDETRGVLISHAWLKMNWTDSKLSWENSSYNGIGELRVTADEVWQPDLTVYNSAESNIVDHFAKTNKIIYSSGNVLWVPTAKFETYCSGLDLKFWPFDSQKCHIKIGSWTYSGNQIDIAIDETPIDLSYFDQKLEWGVLKTSAERHVKFYPCCVEPYVDITFHVDIQRRSPTFKAIVVTPALAVVMMTLASFWVPPTAAVEKLLLNGLACVVISIFLVYFSHLLPVVAAGSPLIVTFYSHTLYLLSISFVISVIVLNLSRNRKLYAVPHSIKANFMDGFIGKMMGGEQAEENVGVEKHSEELRETPFEEHRNSDDHHIIQTSASEKPTKTPQNDWIRLAIIIDRLAFFIYVFIFIAMGFLQIII